MDLTKTAETAGNLVSKFEEFSLQTEDKLPEYIKERKKKAYNNFQSWGIPTKKQEEYKYTDFSAALKKEYAIGGSSDLNTDVLKKHFYPNLEANTIIILNGIFKPEFSNIQDKNLEVVNYANGNAEILKKYFGTEVYTSKDPFAELNTAFASGGVTIQVAKGKIIEKPIVIYYFSDTRTQAIMTQPRALILVEENAQVQIVESFHTIGDNASFINGLTDLVLHENTLVEYYKIQNDSPGSYHIGTTVAHQEGKSVFNAAAITLNGAITRNNLNVILNAPYSESTFYGLYFINGKQLVDNHTMVDHAVPNCQSNEIYKGILDERAVGVFNGKIIVKQDAQKTNSFQSNRNILLSKDAVINTKPQLEIFADDVKCSHGATVGQLDEEALFYLRSRGLSRESAISLLLIAFARDIVEHIKIAPLQHYLNQAIEKRLGN